MSIRFGDILQHNNPNYPIVDITDIKGGLRSIATFSDASLLSEFTTPTGVIPEKYKTGYSLMLERSTGTIYYLSGISATNSSDWTPIGGGNVDGTGVTNSIVKWVGSTSLGNSNITDNGDTVTINGNLMVIGTTLTVFTENLLVKDPIILLAGSQSGVPTYDSGLFINRGSSDTQAFIWDESETEFKFISTTSGATTSGNVSIGTYSSVRTGVLSVGTGTASNSRFIVSSSGGTVSLIVDENGYVYNRGRGNISTNTVFGAGALSVNTSGYRNTAIGVNTLLSNMTGFDNTAVGANSLYSNTGTRNTAIGANTLYYNISGVDNTAIGVDTLLFNKTGSQNTAVGRDSLISNQIGYDNTALGHSSLYKNITGYKNTALGAFALYNNTSGAFLPFFFTAGTGYVDGTYTNVQLVYATGSNNFITAPIVEIGISGGEVSYVNTTNPGSGFSELGTVFTINSYGTYSAGSGFEIVVNGFESGNWNTALGHASLYNNTTGQYNTSIGYQSLYSNTQGQTNTAIGPLSLYDNTTGQYNTSIGHTSLYNNTTGESNIAIGYQSLYSNTIGNYNTAIGSLSLYNNKGDENTAIGWWSLIGNTTGQYNTAIGMGSLSNNQTGSYNIAIGKQAGIYRVGGFVSATNSNNSIFIGYNTTSGATTSNNTNEIVIGHATIGNGSNTVTLGNGSVTKTYLKGKVQLPAPTTSGGSYSILTRNDVTGEVEKILPTYKLYTALLTQSGTASPSVTVLENTLGTVTYSRNSTGLYAGTLAGAFTIDKTFVLVSKCRFGDAVDRATAQVVAYGNFNVNQFVIETTDSNILTDGIMDYTSIEIRVYN